MRVIVKSIRKEKKISPQARTRPASRPASATALVENSGLENCCAKRIGSANRNVSLFEIYRRRPLSKPWILKSATARAFLESLIITFRDNARAERRENYCSATCGDIFCIESEPEYNESSLFGRHSAGYFAAGQTNNSYMEGRAWILSSGHARVLIMRVEPLQNFTFNKRICRRGGVQKRSRAPTRSRARRERKRMWR